MDPERFDESGLIREQGYRETMENVVLPYLKAHEEDITVLGAGDKPLFCSVFTPDKPRGTVFIVHGFTENAFKFSELIHSLLLNGYCVCAHDQRGHGRSWKDPEAVKDDPSLTHVSDFNEYVEDLDRVVAAVRPKVKEPLAVLAHSMGGAVTALYLESHPDVFKRAVLCAPMIAPNRKGLPYGVALGICNVARAFGRSKKRMLMSGPYKGPEDFDTSCATSRARFDWYDRVKFANPPFQNNSPSFGWTREALKVTEKILKEGAVERITIPVRVYTADTDFSVLEDAQIRFADRLKNGKRIFVKGSRHEIYRSGDDVVIPWWKEILKFFGGADS